MVDLIWFLIAVFLILMLIIASISFFLMKKYKAMVAGITCILTIGSALVFYITNQIYIKSYISPVNYYEVYDSSQDTEIDFIKLPSGSVWLFKTPTDIYYNKRNCEECKEYFNRELNNMKQEGKIDDYKYDKYDKKFIIDVNGLEFIDIIFIGDTGQRRYGVLVYYSNR